MQYMKNKKTGNDLVTELCPDLAFLAPHYQRLSGKRGI